jgi:hypothetical protein
MKAPLKRDYFGIDEKRVIQEKVEESYQDRLRLIHLVPVRLARKATLGIGRWTVHMVTEVSADSGAVRRDSREEKSSRPQVGSS